MPLHDFSCSQCGATIEAYRPVTERASTNPPTHCGHPMLWIPRVGALDLGGSFQSFVTQVRQPDGTYRATTVDSLAKLRSVERATEVAARNGEGEALRFRMWSHDRSNGDANAFGPDPAPTLTPEVKARFGLRGGVLKSVDAPTVELGPGVTESSASALVDP